eukprot:CAMPEP_0182897210 /NCGR_PEP_ID=MMETSP0034_2-20130328/26754_1 /TAXON_ID=156128 /ORGANISM="Nephroselmis pyriformis, Strain CCMP717" /LENGTH=58 /DNA_ID=CAMNT_0025031115 /DNA_START=73 /DNA_END=246 /DNA_ORIENTATION=+
MAVDNALAMADALVACGAEEAAGAGDDAFSSARDRGASTRNCTSTATAASARRAARAV